MIGKLNCVPATRQKCAGDWADRLARHSDAKCNDIEILLTGPVTLESNMHAFETESKLGHRDLLRRYSSYWSVISIGIRLRPESSEPSAFPITAPNALIESVTFIACPSVGDAVSRSPTSTLPYSASTLQ